MSEHSVHLIWRRGSETLDCRVEGIAEPSCHLQIKPGPGGDLDLRFKTSVRLDVVAETAERQINEAAEQADIEKSGGLSDDSGVRHTEWARRELHRGDARQLDVSRLGLGSVRQQGLHGQTNQAAQFVQGYANVAAGQISATPSVKRESGK